MEMIALDKELKENSYPGRGIIIGRSADGTKAVTAYFIMGRSENSRNRVFVEDGEGIRTQAFDPSKLVDPSLIIYAPVPVLGNKTIVTTVTRQTLFTKEWIISSLSSSLYVPESLSQMHQTIHHVFPELCMWRTALTVMQCPF